MTGVNAPIIIVGAARSGTKFLRDILAVGSGAKAVPYDVNYVWRKGVAQAAHDRLDPNQLTTDRRQFIRSTLPRLAKLHAGQRLIEKSVSNTLRVPFVSAVFPEARFVHLIRDGREVIESALRQWKAPPDWKNVTAKLRELQYQNLGYALWYARNAALGLFSGRMGGKVWGPRYPGIELDAQTKTLVEVCALQWQHSVNYALADLALLPADRVFEIRYEDLVAGPTAVQRLVADLQLPDHDAILSEYRMRVKSGGGERWRSLSEHECRKMYDIIGPTLRDLGYRTQ